MQPALIPNRKFRGDPAAQRSSREVNLIESHLLDEVEIELGEVASCVDPLRRIRWSKSRMLWNDHFKVLRQRFHKRNPTVRTACPVQAQERLPGASAPHAHIATGNLLDGVAHIRHVFLRVPRLASQLLYKMKQTLRLQRRADCICTTASVK